MYGAGRPLSGNVPAFPAKFTCKDSMDRLGSAIRKSLTLTPSHSLFKAKSAAACSSCRFGNCSLKAASLGSVPLKLMVSLCT